MLSTYRNRVKAGDINEESSRKLIHAILMDDEYNNDEERIRDMLAFVIAGFDTTANTLAFRYAMAEY